MLEKKLKENFGANIKVTGKAVTYPYIQGGRVSRLKRVIRESRRSTSSSDLGMNRATGNGIFITKSRVKIHVHEK